MRFFIILCTIIFGAPVNAGGSLPPRGKRLYFLEDTKQFKPTAIGNVSERPKAAFLRDPIPAGSRKVARPIAVPPRPGKKVRLTETGKLKFGSQAVSGRLSKPRLDFQLESLEVGRVDETERIDFVSRVFNTADPLEPEL